MKKKKLYILLSVVALTLVICLIGIRRTTEDETNGKGNDYAQSEEDTIREDSNDENDKNGKNDKNDEEKTNETGERGETVIVDENKEIIVPSSNGNVSTEESNKKSENDNVENEDSTEEEPEQSNESEIVVLPFVPAD